MSDRKARGPLSVWLFNVDTCKGTDLLEAGVLLKRFGDRARAQVQANITGADRSDAEAAVVADPAAAERLAGAGSGDGGSSGSGGRSPRGEGRSCHQMNLAWARLWAGVLILSLLQVDAVQAGSDDPEIRAYVNDTCIVADEPYLMPPAEAQDAADQSTARFFRCWASWLASSPS